MCLRLTYRSSVRTETCIFSLTDPQMILMCNQETTNRQEFKTQELYI